MIMNKDKFLIKVWTFFLWLPLSATITGYGLASVYEEQVSIDEWFGFTVIASIPIYIIWFLKNFSFWKEKMITEEFV